MLAHHFSLAEDWERALDYLLKAAEKATQAFGLRQALELYGEALEAARRLGDRVPAGDARWPFIGARADLFFGTWATSSRSARPAEAPRGPGPARRGSPAGGRRARPARLGRCSGSRTSRRRCERAAGSDRDRRGARGAGTARRRAVRPRLRVLRQRAGSTRPRRIGPGARDRAGAGRSPIRGAGAAHARHAAELAGTILGRAWSSAARGPRIATGASARRRRSLPEPLEPGAGPDRYGELRRGARGPRPRGWPSPRRSGTTPTSPASSTRWAGCASSAATSPGASSSRSSRTR